MVKTDTGAMVSMLRASPAFAAYLAALALLPWRWLSPLATINERAIPADCLVASVRRRLSRRSQQGASERR